MGFDDFMGGQLPVVRDTLYVLTIIHGDRAFKAAPNRLRRL